MILRRIFMIFCLISILSFESWNIWNLVLILWRLRIWLFYFQFCFTRCFHEMILWKILFHFGFIWCFLLQFLFDLIGFVGFVFRYVLKPWFQFRRINTKIQMSKLSQNTSPKFNFFRFLFNEMTFPSFSC